MDRTRRAMRQCHADGGEVVNRATWFPVGDYSDGTTRLAWPGFIYEGYRSLRKGMEGERLGPEDALNLGGMLVPGTRAARSTAGLTGKHPYSRIEGIPQKFKLPDGVEVDAKPIPGVIDAARDYAKEQGMRYQQPTRFPKIDEDRAVRIASEYEKAPHAPDDPRVQQAYEQLAKETLAQYRALTKRGFQFRFMDKDADGNIIDPYAKSPAMGYRDLAEKKTLQIFPTDAGFGTKLEGVELNPLLRPSGESFDGKPALMNDLFRAVHDAYGHFGYGNAYFRAPGEERAWSLHSNMFSPAARRAMTSETRGQNSWLNYGPHAQHNRTASGADTIYAQQKSTYLPDWVINEGRAPVSRMPYTPLPKAGSFAGLTPVNEDRE